MNQPPPIPGSLPPTSNPFVSFDLKSANRTKAAVRYVEGLPKYSPGGGADLDRGQIPGWVAYSGPSGVAARVGATPGSANVELYRVVGGVLTADGRSVNAYNLSLSPVGGGKYVVVTWASGVWVVVFEDCGA